MALARRYSSTHRRWSASPFGVPSFAADITTVEGRAAVFALRREFDRKFCGLLSEGVATGEFVVDDVQMASLAIGGIVSWSYVWYRPDGRLTHAETAEQISALVMAMIQAKAERRSVRSAPKALALIARK